MADRGWNLDLVGWRGETWSCGGKLARDFRVNRSGEVVKLEGEIDGAVVTK